MLRLLLALSNQPPSRICNRGGAIAFLAVPLPFSRLLWQATPTAASRRF